MSAVQNFLLFPQALKNRDVLRVHLRVKNKLNVGLI